MSDTYNPIATLSTVDTTDDLLDTAALVLSFSRYDWAVLNQIVTTHGRTRIGAAVARAYFDAKED